MWAWLHLRMGEGACSSWVTTGRGAAWRRRRPVGEERRGETHQYQRISPAYVQMKSLLLHWPTAQPDQLCEATFDERYLIGAWLRSEAKRYLRAFNLKKIKQPAAMFASTT